MDKYPATTRWLGDTPVRQFGMKARAGEIGIEIETEGANLPEVLQYHWDAKGDGSLRATTGTPYEYVLRNPIPRKKVPEVLRYLNKKFTESEAVPNYSYRTSVHVHVNAQTLSIKETLTWLSCYFIVEDLVTEYCGAHRVGNRFCLRASDAEAIVGNIVQALLSGNIGVMANPTYRYAACNMSALGSFGSIEFRAMRGTNDETTITRWVELLLSIRDASKDFTSPRDVVEAFSRLGPRAFFERVVPGWFFQEYQWHPNRDTSMWDGVRRIMDIAYCGIDWDTKTKKVEYQTTAAVVDDPLDVPPDHPHDQLVAALDRENRVNAAMNAELRHMAERIQARAVPPPPAPRDGPIVPPAFDWGVQEPRWTHNRERVAVNTGRPARIRRDLP